MNWNVFLLLLASCLTWQQPVGDCLGSTTEWKEAGGLRRRPEAVEVALSAEAAVAWDVTSGQTLYQRHVNQRRPVASLQKLLAALAARVVLDPAARVTIPPEVTAVQRQGADISLPVGKQVTVRELLAAGLIASANDAMVTLAVAAKESEPAFVDFANTYAGQLGLNNTRLSNATGLSGGEQYSTAQDMRILMSRAYQDAVIGPILAQEKGTLDLGGGAARTYVSTNKLLGTYLPILAAKTGYTTEAGENLALITEQRGRKLGAVILGSRQRFQDMKILVEWINRNYTW